MTKIKNTHTLGFRIRLLRQKRGWSQGDVAKRLNISIPAFSKIEICQTDINMSRVEQIAALFEVPVYEIIMGGDQTLLINGHADAEKLKTKIGESDKYIVALQARIIDLYEEVERRRGK